MSNRDRLLIITLETPSVKQELLRMARHLRDSEKWGNIFITPDLTPAERQAAKKLREELEARKKAGEANLVIRRGKIVAAGIGTHPVPQRPNNAGGSQPVVPGESDGRAGDVAQLHPHGPQAVRH